MAVHPGSDLISSTIRRNGVWEGALCRKILEHFDAAALDTPATLFTFVDVGANIGYHSLCVASHGFRTLSIEALDSNYGALARSVSLNGYESRMHTYHAAVAAAPAAAPAATSAALWLSINRFLGLLMLSPPIRKKPELAYVKTLASSKPQLLVLQPLLR